ncbi:MAG TPA: hypothetical protein VF456_12810, partial [Vicinamibacterales bacterium]
LRVANRIAVYYQLIGLLEEQIELLMTDVRAYAEVSLRTHLPTLPAPPATHAGAAVSPLRTAS